MRLGLISRNDKRQNLRLIKPGQLGAIQHSPQRNLVVLVFWLPCPLASNGAARKPFLKELLKEIKRASERYQKTMKI
jgi:hypothetical protein